MIEQLEIQPDKEQEAIVSAVDEKIRILYRQRAVRIEVYEKISALARELEKKYPNARQYRLFHVLISSGEPGSLLDFPGEDSVAKQIDNLYKEYIVE